MPPNGIKAVGGGRLADDRLPIIDGSPMAHSVSDGVLGPGMKNGGGGTSTFVLYNQYLVPRAKDTFPGIITSAAPAEGSV